MLAALFGCASAAVRDRNAIRSDGFTLVELLVVIAIIGILVAVTLGVVSRFLASGKAAKCTANLRQLGIATQVYCGDNAGALPMTGVAPFNNPPWYQPLVPYADAQMKAGSQLAIAGTGIRLFQCPAYQAPPARDVTYAPNVLSANVRLNQIVKPSAKIWLITSTDSYSVNGSGLQRINFPHNNRANLLFFDGHTELLTRDALQAVASFAFNPASP